MYTKSIAVMALVLVAQLSAVGPPETRAIPMNTIYATFEQKGMKSVENEAAEADLARLFAVLDDSPRQAILCTGSDVADAVTGSIASFMMMEEEIPTLAGTTDETLWLAAFLGVEGSNPPAYQVRRVEVQGKTIRVAYEPMPATETTCDLRAYMFWVRIGPMEAGAYRLEMFDVAEQAVTQTRTWHVMMR